MSKCAMSPMYIQLTFGASDTVKTFKATENGWIKQIYVHMPNFDNNPTGTLTITDQCNPITGFVSKSVTVFSATTIAENADTKFGDNLVSAEVGEIPIDKNYLITYTLSGAPGGTGGEVFIAMYLKH